MKVCELLSSLDGVAYLERTTTSSLEAIAKTKNAIRKAFQFQIEKKGFSLVETLSACPTNWKMSPQESHRWMAENMEHFYPPGVFKEPQGPEGTA